MSESPPPPRPPRTQSSRNPFYNDGEQTEVLFNATERPAIRDSEGTLTDLPPPPRTGERYQGEYGKFYDDGHPAEIPNPPNAVSAHDRRPMRRAAVSFSEKDSVREYRADSDAGVDEDSDDDDEGEGDELLKEGPGPGPGSRKRDILSVIGSLRSTKGEAADKERGDWWTEQEDKKKKKRKNGQKKRHTKKRETLNLGDSDQEMGSDVASNDEETDDEDQTEQNLSYKDRRKQAAQAKIKINVTSMENRQEFLTVLARALMKFGAPSHRIESQLATAARILGVQAEFIHLPSVIICSFGDQELGCSETQFVKCSSKLALGSLHKVHDIYRKVVHDEISAKAGSTSLLQLMRADDLYPRWVKLILAFSMSALICPLSFGGSFLDMWVAGSGALLVAFLQNYVARKNTLYANVFEISAATIVSLAARGLSSIRARIFCYSAISSSGIVGILPGYLILTSSLELASKNIVCGSVRMVYALIYTLFLGFGLQIGSDIYLLCDSAMKKQLADLATNLAATTVLTGSWTADNDTRNGSIPTTGTWTFTRTVPIQELDIVHGCFRPVAFPWYLQPFPWWNAFFTVPIFSVLSSLMNMQPYWSFQLFVMVFISCLAFAANIAANHFIFNRSDVVSAIGAFVVGILGNIYSRKFSGTAFTSMVTGVLFLVPSGLSQSGGIAAVGNGVEIGGAMIAVTIGITVGLFMSQALVYMFGNKKNAASFTF